LQGVTLLAGLGELRREVATQCLQLRPQGSMLLARAVDFLVRTVFHVAGRGGLTFEFVACLRVPHRQFRSQSFRGGP